METTGREVPTITDNSLFTGHDSLFSALLNIIPNRSPGTLQPEVLSILKSLGLTPVSLLTDSSGNEFVETHQRDITGCMITYVSPLQSICRTSFPLNQGRPTRGTIDIEEILITSHNLNGPTIILSDVFSPEKRAHMKIQMSSSTHRTEFCTNRLIAISGKTGGELSVHSVDRKVVNRNVVRIPSPRAYSDLNDLSYVSTAALDALFALALCEGFGQNEVYSLIEDIMTVSGIDLIPVNEIGEKYDKPTILRRFPQ